MKKKIIELWRWYFLGISELPIMWGVVAGFVSFVFWFIFDSQFIINPLPENMPPLITVLAVWLGATAFFIFLHLYVVKKKITVFPSRAFQAVIIYASLNEPLTYRHPLWGKFDYKIFKFPKGFGGVILQNHGYEQTMHLELEAQSRKVILPFRFKMIWQEIPDAWDFHEIAIWQGEEADGKKVFQLNECLQNIFVKFNLEENRQKLEEATKELIAHESPLEHQAALKIIDSSVDFPTHLLSATIFTSLISQDIKMILFDREYSVNLPNI